VGLLVAVEGLDGAGKRTLSEALRAGLAARSVDVTGFAFPRYDVDVYGQLVADALRGRLGDLADSVHGMAVLFALDRRGAAESIRAALARPGVVLVDRYAASNAAYQAARLGQDGDGEFVEWVRTLEFERFAIPIPDLQLLLRVPPSVAAARAASRERADATRTRDSYESDAALQRRCARVYDRLAECSWVSPWRVVDGAECGQVFTGAADLVAELARLANVRRDRH